jgi:hypothetical protein
MRYALYGDTTTHKFALLQLPSEFIEGDKLPILATERWFDSREEAVAALPELLNREECESGLDEAATQTTAAESELSSIFPLPEFDGCRH